MANTSVLIKRSSVTGRTPSSLVLGELAINYTDGKLFYSNGTNVLSISGGGSSSSSFSTISDGTNLIVATTPTNTLLISGSNGIRVLGDGTAKSITIGLPAPGASGNVLTSTGSTWQSSAVSGGGGSSTVTISPAFVAATSTLTPAVGTTGAQILTGVTTQNQLINILTPTGTPQEGQKLVIRIKDSAPAVGWGIIWSASYTAIGCYLPGITVPSKTMYIGCMYNSGTTSWDVVSVTIGF